MAVRPVDNPKPEKDWLRELRKKALVPRKRITQESFSFSGKIAVEKSDCGANKQGGGGFTAGNTCAKKSPISTSRSTGESDFDWLVRMTEQAEKAGIPLPDSAYGEDHDDDGFMAESLAKYLHVRTAPLLLKIGQVAPKSVTENTGLHKFEKYKQEALSHLGLKDVTLERIAQLAGLSDDAEVKLHYGSSPRDFSPQIRISSSDGFDNQRYIRKYDDYGFHIENSSFRVTETGKGLGTKILARQISSAQEMGIKSLRTFAARGDNDHSNGYYTWPRLGYDGDVPWYSVYNRKGGSATKDDTPESIRDAKRISDVMRTKEGRDWWKQHGVGIDLEFDLKEGSHSMNVFREYLAETGRL